MASSRTRLGLLAAVIACAGIAAIATFRCAGKAPETAPGGAQPAEDVSSGPGPAGGPTTAARPPRAGRADGATLAVSVRDAQGRPVAGATVVVLPIDATSGGHVESGAVVARTDAEGEAAVVGLGASESHEICVRAEGLVPTGRRFVAPGVRTAGVTMRPITRHRVRLVDQDGAGLPGVEVTLTDAPRGDERRELHRFAATTTGEDGEFEFPLEPDGATEYRAWVDEPAGLPWHLGGATTGLAWKPGDATLRVARAWAARGRVRSLDGKPLHGVAIRLRGSRGTLLSPFSFPDGGFHVFGLDRDESVGIRADMRCATAPADDAPGWTLVRGGDTSAELVVDPGAYVVVKLEYVGGGDYGPGVLTWSPRAADAAEVTLDKGDQVLLGGLDPARRYTFTAGPDFFGHVAIARDVVPDGRTVSLEYVAGVPTKGVVRNADGSPRQGAIEIAAWTPDQPGVRVAVECTKDDGTFEFAGLAPGRWLLRTSDEIDAWGETEAEAGAEKIEIRTDRSRHRSLRPGGGR